ncbi:hypothetical protein C1H46_044453 [Malus baccata]|uniref:TATA-binding protein-associated factor BTAF1 n=1 Tax=Malus baccata TaxID=106549 RepID=A0A540K708_MALBA|nr:hypothetical protein C1H46_044453 [Malus baccata]
MDVNDMIKDEDLISHNSHGNGTYPRVSTSHNIQQLVANMVPGVLSERPSPRELNLLKRKAKITSKDQSKGWSEDGDMEVSCAQNIPPKGACPDSFGTNKEILDFDNHEEKIEHDGEGRWPFQSFAEQLILDMFDQVWEVRHGSVMALREILTHQGASAGAFIPDLSLEGAMIGELENKCTSSTMKRDREIDLNMQVPIDESEPELKKLKFEDVTSPFVDTMVSSSKCGDFDVSIQVEDSRCKSPSAQVNGQLHFSSVKVDPCEQLAQTTELKGQSHNKGSFQKMDVLKRLSENSDMMNLFKLARHSWLKNCEFLQDCAIRFLCVLSLDRFGDYVSDQVVAPVRETCAQALGVVFKYMHPSLVHETLNILLKMQCRPEWEVRHGSLLGIKYLVAVRQEMLHNFLDRVLPACKAGLEDPDDDVRAVAADALIPTSAAIVALKGETLHSIVMLLWDILLDLDDLSPSTSSVMNLLAEIYSQEDMIPWIFEDLTSKEFDLNEFSSIDDTGEGLISHDNPFMLSTLAPRLWPFMRHSITSVRYSAIRTLCPLGDLEIAASLYMSSWIELATTSYGSALDSTKMFWPVALPRKSHFKAAAKMRAAKLENESCRNIGLESSKGSIPEEKGGDASTNNVQIVVGADVEMSVTHTRVVTAAALGVFASRLYEGSMQYVIDPLTDAFTSLSGVQRQVASMVLISWFKEIKRAGVFENAGVMPGFLNHLKNLMLDFLACLEPAFPTNDPCLPYAELSRTYCKMRSEASQLLNAIQSSGIFQSLLSTTKIDLEKLNVDNAINFASKLPMLCNDIGGNNSLERHIVDDIESAKQRLLTTCGYLKCVQSNLHVTVSSLVAASVVWMSELPERLNPIILPLMASIKREQEEILQEKAAEALAELISHCISRSRSPNDKLIKNICNLTCMDPRETPQAAVICSIDIIDDQDLLSFGTNTGKQKSKVILAGSEDRSKVEGFISRRGSELALRHLCMKFGASLFDEVPKLWDCLTEVLKPSSIQSLNPADEKKITQTLESVKDPQTLINNIQVVRSIAPMLNEDLKPKLLTLLPYILKCIRHSHVAVRLASSRCITTMAKSMEMHVMGAVIENAIPMLGDMTSVGARQGAGMLISLLVQGLGVELVPYAPFLVVPLLRCMSDCDQSVRQSVTRSFAALVPLLPLARGLPPPVGLTEGFSRSAEDATFLEQLLDNSHIDDYKLCTELKVTLRRYQQEGINWLAFLKRFKLHGILCDDMGLGKTLQALAIVASDIVEHQTSNDGNLPSSLIICPSTLVGHWAFEIEKYIDLSVISTLQYVGSAQERIALREHFGKHNAIITSYDVVRKDIDYLGKLIWNYCILDEGHVIKNAKSKVTLSVKQLKAQHRLILSGTPIQNNVMDLWSLFDFLMPGFLGTERQFQATFGKPLVAARDPKCSAKDAEAGALAMEALHKQDRFCDLSPVQLKLYEQFSGSHVRQEISSIVKQNETADTGGHSESPRASSHVFQALQYLLKLCSHPLLVLEKKVPDSIACLLSELLPGGSDTISELHKPYHSPKLVALQEILEECGIGVDASSSEGAISVGQHRVLIFAQHKAFLDLIERDLFHTHMKSSVTYLRLDGSVEPEKRFDIVKAFNSDPTIDVLLLTTHVGGLGLNLTSADTLVFMEHDWNPMRDHQAMDRAHRLGQKKVVNVHRLIMRGTLEEKVMSLQKFKLSVANAVINAENASMKTMNTDQLLDLFATAETSKKGTSILKHPDGKFDGDMKLMGTGKGLKAILGGLEELWDQSQYTEEYNLSNFLAKLDG